MTEPQSAFTLEDQSSKLGAKIWTVTFDLPGEKVNKMGKRVLHDFERLLTELREKKNEIDALVLRSGKPGNFIAGADITLIQSAQSAEEATKLSQDGQKLLNEWEDLPFPTVVAINGAAMGGGCELSLASSAIVMSSDPAARIGLPEVMLGLLPGMGGCVRLPRKIGLANALDMILTGKTLTGEKAYKTGLAEGFIPKENFDEQALQWVKKNLNKLKSGVRIAKEPKLGGMGGPVGSLMEKTPMGRTVIFKKAREGVMSKTKGQYPAALEILDVLSDTGASYDEEKAKGWKRDRALTREAKGFGKLAATPVSKSLIQLFFLTEAVKKSNGLAPGKTADSKKIRTAAVLGAGVMGGGIAQLFADKEITIRMKDLTTVALGIGVQSATKLFDKSVKRRKITKREGLQKLNRIAPTLDYEGFRAVDCVVEAIVENMDVKKKVLAESEGYIKDSCILASNTSSLSITEMQKALKRPENFVGMHFFNPVSKMPLIEVIRGEKTSDEAVSTIFQLSKQLGKTPIVVKDAPGFLVNRLLAPYLNEAVYLLSEGAPIDELDQALLKFGMPMGPMELIDEVGVDVAEKVAHILHDGFGDRMEPATLNAKLVGEKRLGKKTGKGLYTYSKDGRDKELDPSVYTLLGVQPTPGKFTSEEMVDRCILAMVNEASRCLEEQIAMSPQDVDLGMIMGTGFPPFRGGLLRYADSRGLREIVTRLQEFEKSVSAKRFAPASALIAYAEKGKFHRDA